MLLLANLSALAERKSDLVLIPAFPPSAIFCSFDWTLEIYKLRALSLLPMSKKISLLGHLNNAHHGIK